MTFTVEYSVEAIQDLQRRLAFLAERDETAARRALKAIRSAVGILGLFPYSCRKAEGDDPNLRELVITFGDAGYVALFRIEGEDLVVILAIRHQLEEDYQ